VDNQILTFEKQFAKAAGRFEVCCILIINVPRFVYSHYLWKVLSGITLARGQDVIIRGQDDVVRSQDNLLRGQDDIIRSQGNLIHMVQKVRPFNRRTYVTTH
jgi:hypothetical protein